MSDPAKKGRGNKKRATINDVAAYLGVSKATVSLALSGSQAVAKQTRNKVVAAAETLGYKPSRLARQLSTGQSEIIGLYLPGYENNSALSPKWLDYTKILTGVVSCLKDSSYNLQLMLVPGNFSQILDTIQEGIFDGMIMVVEHDDQFEFLESIHGFNYPLVTVTGCVNSQISSVRIDSEYGARKVVEFLLGLGHKKIAYLSGPEQDIDVLARKRSFIKTALLAGIKPNPAYIKDGEWTIEAGRQLCRELLRLEDKPTAIFCDNDYTAVGVIQALNNVGLKVPQDFSVISYGNYDISLVTKPRLTTVKQPQEELGQRATQIILELLQKGNETAEHISLQPELVVRESCLDR